MAVRIRDIPEETRGSEPLMDQVKRGRDQLADVGAEVSELFADMRVLAQKELELARTEVSEQVAAGKQSAMFGGAAAILALLTLAFAAVTLMFALDQVVQLWLAALITTGALLALTALAAMMLMSTMKQITGVPKKAMESISEDMQWVKRQLSFNAK